MKRVSNISLKLFIAKIQSLLLNCIFWVSPDYTDFHRFDLRTHVHPKEFGK